MTTTISNPSADRNEKISNAATVLGKSKLRKKVFEAIYTGKKKTKSVSEIMKISGINNKILVLQETARLVHHGIIRQLPKRIKNETVYEKDGFYQHTKKQILAAFGNKEKIDNIATRFSPRINVMAKVKVIPQRKSFDVSQITIDDIDDFSKVHSVTQKISPKPIDEKKFKDLIQKIIAEKGIFKDWGGEQNDLYSTRIKIKGKRYSTSFAFKGKGKSGKLKPSMMGKNGDQILRLFQSDSSVFILQYWDQIDQSVYSVMNSFAVNKSAQNQKKIYYCIIDGQDSQRIIKAYK